jgi:hypothetical protein
LPTLNFYWDIGVKIQPNFILVYFLEEFRMVVQPIIDPAIAASAAAGSGVGAAKVGATKAITVKIGASAKAGSFLTGTKVAIAGLSKSVAGTFWAGAGWKLGLGLGLGVWGPVMLTAVSAAAIYNVTPAIIKAGKNPSS